MATRDPYQLHFRLPEDIGKQVDRYAAFVKSSTGVEVSRTDAAVALMRRGLVAWEETQPRGGRASA